jgi:hypothetical protein
MTPLHHAYLLKGWMLDKNPPKEVTEAVEAIMGALVSPPAPDRISGAPVEIELPELANSSSEAEPAQAAALPTPEKPRRQSNMSPEARAAAAERMRAYQARKKAEREAEGAKTSPADKPFAPVTADKLISEHNDYAGKRQDGTLTDSDWPDIKARLARGDGLTDIAGDYDLDEEDLSYFVESWRRREAKQVGGSHSGEALALR